MIIQIIHPEVGAADARATLGASLAAGPLARRYRPWQRTIPRGRTTPAASSSSCCCCCNLAAALSLPNPRSLFISPPPPPARLASFILLRLFARARAWHALSLSKPRAISPATDFLPSVGFPARDERCCIYSGVCRSGSQPPAIRRNLLNFGARRASTLPGFFRLPGKVNVGRILLARLGFRLDLRKCSSISQDISDHCFRVQYSWKRKMRVLCYFFAWKCL